MHARLEAEEFAILAVECDTRCLPAAQARLRVDLRSAGVPISVGVAARRVGEELSLTHVRAQAAMLAVHQRHLGRGS